VSSHYLNVSIGPEALDDNLKQPEEPKAVVHIRWKDHYRINYKEIDAAHQGLLGILNRVIDLVDQRADPGEVSGIVRELAAYAQDHFTREERYLQAAGYPELGAQRAEHGVFIQKIIELDRTYDPSDPGLLLDAHRFLKDWFLDHILHSDMRYVPAMKRYASEAPVRAILFAFDGTIGRQSHRAFLEPLAPACGKPVADLESLIFNDLSLTGDYQCGAIDSAQFLAEIAGRSGHAFAEAEVIQAFLGIRSPFPAAWELIRALKPHYRLGLIANTNPWHFELGTRAAADFPPFDAVTLSYQVRALHPDPRLLEDALEKLDLMAEECVLVDARPALPSALSRHPVRRIAGASPETLAAELRRLNVRLP